jgi:hypothetical protein
VDIANFFVTPFQFFVIIASMLVLHVALQDIIGTKQSRDRAIWAVIVGVLVFRFAPGFVGMKFISSCIAIIFVILFSMSRQ